MKTDSNLCPVCRVFKELCLCDLIKKFDLKTRLTLLIHTKELKRITNTGRFAAYSLANFSIVQKGQREVSHHPEDLFPQNYHSVLLTPYGSTLLNASFVESLSRPVNLIVPDGTWPQVRRMINSEPKLSQITHVKLPPYHGVLPALRRTPHENFLPTLGAIAYAFGILENGAIQNYFEKLLDTMTGRLRNRLKRK